MKIQIFIVLCFLIASVALMPSQSSGKSSRVRSHFNYDYSQTLVMKMALCMVNKDGTPNVLCDLDQALAVIEKTDQLTLGVPKIIYLVGWQYNGHDDKYPAFFEVNPSLKRPGAPDSRSSLIWLMNEAKKHHTTISLHINMTDAYDDSPLWDEYVKNDLISKNEDVGRAKIFLITDHGFIENQEAEIMNNILNLSLKSGDPVLILPDQRKN